MNRETALQEVRRQISCKDYLEKSKNGMYCCPFCGSGHGTHGTGAVKVYDTNTWTCHACNKSGDVIDLYQEETGTDFNAALEELAERLGYTIDAYRPTAAEDFAEGAERHEKADRVHNNPAAPKNATEGHTGANYTTYYKECRERLTDKRAISYLSGRGISQETAAAYWIGFDPEADPASAPGGKGKKWHPCPRLIIPSSAGYYLGRRTDGGEQYAKVNSAGSAAAIFNEKALYAQGVQEVFVTEGALDALSIIEAGSPAIALNSAGNATLLIKRLESKPTAATLIICKDKDERGEKAAQTIKEGLKRLNISFIEADITGSHKDPNEALTADRQAFIEAIEEAQRQTAAKPDNTQYYINALMAGDIEHFKDEKKTGFSNLDAEAGGLFSGLYVLAAISSLGKTSFALQMADQIAEQGNEVLFFSLEQSRLELVSKSIARRMAQNNPKEAVSSLTIRKGYLGKPVMTAAAEYKEAVADRVSIIEGNFNCNVSFIGDYIRRYTQKNGTRPVVIIDYLQILQPAEERKSTKETIDNTITELKRISRDQDITIIAISSVNRANYLTPIDYESLKESGSIEYSADVVWGLQLQCLNEDLFLSEKKIKEKRQRVREEKRANPRKIELLCIKNRYGKPNYSCFFNYYAQNDLFEVDHAPEFEE